MPSSDKGAEESSCKQVWHQIEDPARSHQAGQDSVHLSSDIKSFSNWTLVPSRNGLLQHLGSFQAADPILQISFIASDFTRRCERVKVVGVRHQVATDPYSVYVVKMIELDGTTAIDITTAVMECLHKHSFHEDFLRECLIALACDGH
ncbi:hypothetical protein NDU88_005949 [Pleurodeles waltl]|uniref:Uncharacterized protein n=1 Tax=Pleurodeles waltl TaxID=8319 RepID=A0AAV7NSU4_PLEWA|nr:hypothetical protein NDU88_005949 [Pleurodeles waltl]